MGPGEHKRAAAAGAEAADGLTRVASGVSSGSCSPYSDRADRATESASHRYHYVICRADLPRGVLAAQIVHAAGESSPGDIREGTNAVVLATPNEAELAAVADRLVAAGIAHVCIREPDRGGELMAIGCVPARKEVLRRVLSALPLLR